MNKMLTLAGTCWFLLNGFAADVAVSWNASQRPTTLADDKIVLTYENNKVKSIVASPAKGDRFVVSGDEMKLAADAAITMETTGALVFKNKLDGTGTLSFQTTFSELHYQKTVPDGLIDVVPNWTLMFPDANLDDYEPVAALQSGGRGTGLNNPNDHYAYNIRRFKDGDGRSVVEFQLKWLSSEEFFKCIKMQLRQGEGGIEGVILGAWNASEMTASIETDIDYMLEHKERFPTCDVYAVKTPTSMTGGYGICCLDLKPVVRPLVQFENFVSNTVKKTTLDLSIGTSVEVRGVGNSAFGQNGYTGTRQIDGQLTILDRTLTLSSPLSGGGTLRIASETPLSNKPYESKASNGNYLTGDEYQAATYRFLNELTNVTAGLTGRAIDPEKGTRTVWSPRFYHYEIADNGLVATCQVQVVTKDDKNIGCSFIEFKQSGYSNIKMHVVRAGLTPKAKGLGVDFRTLADKDVTWTNITTGASGNGISMLYPTNYWSTASRRMVILKAGESSYTFSPGARIEVEGSEGVEQCLDLSSTNAIPHNGTIVAKNGGNVFFMKGTGSTWGTGMDSTCLWRAEVGGHLWLPYVSSSTVKTVGTIGPSQEIELWGGQFHVGSFSSSGTVPLPTSRESGNYLCLLTLADGAVIDGALSVYVGNANSAATWKVRGSSPSYCNINLKMTGNANNDLKYFKWDVADVTADDGEDLFVNGRLGRYDADNTHSNIVMRKVGKGTIRINCPNTVDKMVLSRTELYDGTWMLGADGVSCAQAPYLMTGGSLAAADGAVNDVGVLSVVSNGTIKVGAGGALRFADSSAASWTLPTGDHIIIDADLSVNALRFGTDANGLSAAQLRMLRKSDGKTRIALDENGWARDCAPGGMIITVR